MGEIRKVDIDTMTGAGKKIELVGREYTILPVRIKDMHYIIGDNTEENLVILDSKKMENDEDINWQLFGLNITDPKRKDAFIYIINNYLFYKEHNMTEELLNEHNWSFKEIGIFLMKWAQISD